MNRFLQTAVTNGVGWTILPALNLYDALDVSNSITIHKIKMLGLKKRLYLATHDEKFKDLLETCKMTFVDCFEQQCLKKIRQTCPELLSGLKLEVKKLSFEEKRGF